MAPKHNTFLFSQLESGRRAELGKADGDIFVYAAPVGQEFAIAFSGGDLLLVSGMQSLARVPGSHGSSWYGVWSRDADKFFFDAGATEVNGVPEISDGFNILGVLDVSSRQVTTSRLRSWTEHFAYCGSRSRLYFEHWPGHTFPPGTDEYDDRGTYIGTSSVAGPLSANCRYSVMWPSAHGPTDWGVYDTRSGVAVLEYKYDWGANDYPRDAPLRQFGVWNPRYDNLLTIRNFGAENTEVYDLDRRKMIRSFPGVWKHSWSADGNSLISVRNGRFIFEPVVR